MTVKWITGQSKTSQLNLREFIGLRGMNDIAFEDLTEEFGKSYKLFLIGKGYHLFAQHLFALGQALQQNHLRAGLARVFMARNGRGGA